MTVKISIIGLGRIGASLGLALAAHKDQVTTLGHDRSPETARRAQKLGAVESISYNLPASVEKADVVILALPFDEIHETLRLIARDLREDAVLLDTAPVKTAIAGWVKELLPPQRHYIGLTPAPILDSPEMGYAGVGAARADLFHKALVAITPPPGTPEAAIQLSSDLVVLLGATPFFMELAEVDGVMAAARLLPELSAAALVETLTSQPGWPDIRKLAGSDYASTTRPLETDGASAWAETILHDQDNALRVLDAYLATLVSLRKAITDGRDKELQGRFKDPS